MNKIKQAGLAGMLLTAGFLSPAAQAGSVILNQGPYSYADGGEFSALTTDPSLSVSGYSSSTGANLAGGGTSFQTFCVQTDVEFSPGSTYNYTVGLNAIGAAQPYLNGFNGSLTVGTAWLYAEFASGDLGVTYNYADSSTGNSRKTDAGILQAAIWALQGESVPSNDGFTTPTTANNPYYNMALNEFGGSATAAAVAATGSDNFGVDILVLSTGNGGAAQNQLYYSGGGPGLTHEGVPDNSTTIGLFALGLCGLAAFARKSGNVQQLN
jgi:hypothetical protein